MLDKSRGRKLAKTGFENFLAYARVRRLKGKYDDNKEVYWLIQFDKRWTQID